MKKITLSDQLKGAKEDIEYLQGVISSLETVFLGRVSPKLFGAVLIELSKFVDSKTLASILYEALETKKPLEKI